MCVELLSFDTVQGSRSLGCKVGLNKGLWGPQRGKMTGLVVAAVMSKGEGHWVEDYLCVNEGIRVHRF